MGSAGGTEISVEAFGTFVGCHFKLRGVEDLIGRKDDIRNSAGSCQIPAGVAEAERTIDWEGVVWKINFEGEVAASAGGCNCRSHFDKAAMSLLRCRVFEEKRK